MHIKGCLIQCFTEVILNLTGAPDFCHQPHPTQHPALAPESLDWPFLAIPTTGFAPVCNKGASHPHLLTLQGIEDVNRFPPFEDLLVVHTPRQTEPSGIHCD